jgi:hypothetical protein
MPYLPLNLIFSYPLPVQIGYFVLCLFIALAGYNRKMGFWGYLFSSILFSPLVGVLMLIVSGKKRHDES